MFAQSQTPTFARPLLNALLAALSARPAAALFTTPFVHLFKAGPSPLTPDTLYSAFTEAAFPGYASVALGTLAGPVITPSTLCEGVFSNASFIAGAIVTPETILGYWVDEGAAPTTPAHYFEYFPAPIPFVNPGDFLDLAVLFGLIFKPQL